MLGSALLMMMMVGSALAPTDMQQAEPLTITDMQIGTPAPGANVLSATISNGADTTLLAVLDVRAMPGMWLLGNWQRQYGFELRPGEVKAVEVEYRFTRMSPEARLRVRVGPGVRTPEGYLRLLSRSYERIYRVGEGNPAALDIERYFQRVEWGPLEIYGWRGSRAAERMGEIAAERARAIGAIGEILDVVPSETIRLVFYPDSATKTSQTGHIGAGMATGHSIVEIYNDELRLDPFHELAHVLIYELGEPPAVLDEGFAIYISQRLGADALEQLGSPGGSIDEAACRALRDGRAHTPGELVALEEIGSPESRAEVAYPEAGSLVGYLIRRYGEERFRVILRAAIAAPGTPAQRVERAIADVAGEAAGEVGAAWQVHLRTACE